MDVREHHPGRNDTMKKKYIKPTIIDLSIEGMTGFGAGSCNEGNNVAIDCPDGFSPTTACNPQGFIPYMPGETCDDGPSAINVCFTGTGAGTTGCSAGGSPQFSCTMGGSDSLTCHDGPTNNICYLGSSQSAPGS